MAQGTELPGRALLGRLADRLHAAISAGPSLQCRPHDSRQRLDLLRLGLLEGPGPDALIGLLLAGQRVCLVEPEGERSPELEALFQRLAVIVEDARLVEQDTGAHVLCIGHPLLQIPADALGGSHGRILAPVALVPVAVELQRGRPYQVTLRAVGEGADLVKPNLPLLAWLERVAGARHGELFDDEAGEAPWQEIAELCGLVGRAAGVAEIPELGADRPLRRAPRPDPTDGVAILSAAVLGLFPDSDQALARDLEAMAEAPALPPLVARFLELQPPEAQPEGAEAGQPLLIDDADPFQAAAVGMARHEPALVIHGPPGTGKSQTILNIIGDHLARGERVLVVSDKRAALDVVHARMRALELDGLCALVHDPQRDQRNLLASVRASLEALGGRTPGADAEAVLRALDEERRQVEDTLVRAHQALEAQGVDGGALAGLVAEWLRLLRPGEGAEGNPVDAPLELLRRHEPEIREVLARLSAIAGAAHPWRAARGLELEAFLERPLAAWREELKQVVEAAAEVDALRSPAMPPFAPDRLAEQGIARAGLAERLGRLVETAPHRLAALARLGPERLLHARSTLDGLRPEVERLQRVAPDPRMALVLREREVEASHLVQWIGTLDRWLAVAGGALGALCWTRRRDARLVLDGLGADDPVADPQAVGRVKEQLQAVLAGLALRAQGEAMGLPADAGDEALVQAFSDEAGVLATLERLQSEPLLAAAASEIRAALAEPARHAALVEALGSSGARAIAIRRLRSRLEACALLGEPFRQEVVRTALQGERCHERLEPLLRTLDGLEDLYRAERRIGALPPELAAALRHLGEGDLSPDEALRVLRRDALAREIRVRLRTTPELLAVEGPRMASLTERWRKLDAEAPPAVREAVRNRWLSLQRSRLLVSTGSRRNTVGAALRRRLILRGRRALRLRQVLAAGAQVEGGDPLLDLRPVWLASPETVAQVFPREPVFDLVVFDEASQVRLEEALPVLWRAHRVVIAGDPKQLPPTRFFESGVAEVSESWETEQEAFEQQQLETEDLLTAALQLELEHCHLDVHYRSRHEGLIAFSNRHFYGGRLQPLPAHPTSRPPSPPVRLVEVGGTYLERTNPAEAEAVLGIVRELLALPDPPSIGIATLNLPQRDLIAERLAEAAAQDRTLARQLRLARGRGEPLFVKNLENVQGDERDHIVISTGFGPDPQGRFYQRFGPLGRRGGERRLNVLVTRARERIHLVTSIPPESYQGGEVGEAADGRALLYAYLAWAGAVGVEDGGARRSARGTALAHALARHLEARGQQVRAGQGCEGFRLDVVIERSDARGGALAVLCDQARFRGAGCPTRWDRFREEALRRSGWPLVRLWSPDLFRDPDGTLQALVDEVG